MRASTSTFKFKCRIIYSSMTLLGQRWIKIQIPLFIVVYFIIPSTLVFLFTDCAGYIIELDVS